MTSLPLVDLLGDRDLVGLVGAGGKTTLMLDLADQLARRNRLVVVTTTTKMSAAEVHAARPGPVFLVKAVGERKVTGPSAEVIDRVFRETRVDYVLVEADGAQRRPLKAPAEHEPVIPGAATFVVVVVGAAALGRPLSEVAHRPERVAALGEARLDDLVTPDLVAAVVGHDDGGMRRVPPSARVVVAIANVSDEMTEAAVDRIAVLLADHPRIERVLAIGPSRLRG